MNHELKEKIIVEASKSFMQHGIKDVTMSQIANGLHISKRTLYEIYDSKEQLLYDCLIRQNEHRQEVLTNLLLKAANTLDFLLMVFQYVLDESKKVSPKLYDDIYLYPNVIDFIKKQRENDMVQAVELLHKCVDEGLFLPHIDYEIIYRMTYHMQEVAHLILREQKLSMSEIFANTIIIFLRGCTTNKGSLLMDDFLKKNQIAL